VLLLALMGASAAAQAALPRLNRTRLRHLSNEGVARAGAALDLVEEPAVNATLLVL
jgi:CBS domain containing-hemolysin-like protein